MSEISWKKEIKWHFFVCILVCLNIGLIVGLLGSEALHKDDFQSQYMPVYKHIWENIRHGNFPLITNVSWTGGFFAGEYQYGIFSVFHVLLLTGISYFKASFAMYAVSIQTVYALVLATGTFALARYYQFPIWLAIIASWTATFNGYLFSFGTLTWIPALVTFAWMPWLWLSLRWTLDKGEVGRACIPAVFIYLITTGGWPHTVLMAVWLTGWMVGREVMIKKNARPLYVAMFIWGLGIVLSLPAVCFIFDLYRQSMRQSDPLDVNSCIVSLRGLVGFFTPTQYSLMRMFDEFVYYRNSAEVFSNIVVPSLFAAPLLLRGKRYFLKFRYEICFFVVTLFLCTIPSFHPFRFSFRWLAMVHLIMAILAGQMWLDYVRQSDETLLEKKFILFLKKIRMARDTEGCKWVACGIIFLAAWLLSYFLNQCGGLRLPMDVALFSALFVIGGMFWLWGCTRLDRSKIPVVAVVVALFTAFVGQCFILFHPKVMKWQDMPADIQKTEPFSTDRTYLFLYTLREVYLIYNDRMDSEDKKVFRLGNTPLYSNMHVVNGYTPMGYSGLFHLIPFVSIGRMEASVIHQIVGHELPKGRLLEQLGIDGLVVPKEYILDEAIFKKNGWSKIYETPLFVVYEAASAPALAHSVVEGVPVENFSEYVKHLRSTTTELWQSLPALSISKGEKLRETTYDKADLGNFKYAPYETNISVQVDTTLNSRASLVAIHRSLYPGHKLYFNDKEVDMIKINGTLPAAIIPAGEKGRLELRFEPWYWMPSLLIAVFAWSILIAWGIKNYLGCKRAS